MFQAEFSKYSRFQLNLKSNVTIKGNVNSDNELFITAEKTGTNIVLDSYTAEHPKQVESKVNYFTNKYGQ